MKRTEEKKKSFKVQVICWENKSEGKKVKVKRR